MVSTALSLELARIEFGLTALYHFLFVPLTLGLPWALMFIELMYISTSKIVYKEMMKFWRKFFALSILINLFSERVFGYEYSHNWQYFLHVVGGAFGHSFSLSTNIAFFTMLGFIALFFFTWNRLNARFHLCITFLMAVLTTLYIVNPMVMNTWMQNPVGYYFDYNTMTIHINNFWQVYTQPLALIRIAHLMCASFLITAMFMLGVSSYYLLKKKHVDFAIHTFIFASIFGLVISLGTLFSGDANGLAIVKNEPEKMAAIEGQWETQRAPASWYLVAFPNQLTQMNHFVIKIPYALSLIATHSLTGTVEGLKPLINDNVTKVEEGRLAYHAMEEIRAGNITKQNIDTFNQYSHYVGYGMLLKKYVDDPMMATSKDIHAAAIDTIPQVSVAFWTFRVMLGCWLICFLILIVACYFLIRKRLNYLPRWYLRVAMYSIPIPYIAAESGWMLTEIGRQPWVVRGILPTIASGPSSMASSTMWGILFFFVFFSILFMVQIYVMFRILRKGLST